MDYRVFETKAKNALAKSKRDFQRGSLESALALAVEASTEYVNATKAAIEKSEKVRLKQQFNIAADFAEQIKSSTNQIKPVARNIEDPIFQFDHDLTTKEKLILLRSSKVNGATYPPWSPQDMRAAEVTDSIEQFIDPSGYLDLSNAQKQVFVGWRRPAEIFGHDVSVLGTGAAEISQDILSDCSVVASLCACALWEDRAVKQLVSKIIYPQSISQSGRYTVKLFFNGVYRKVVIDDFLPTTSSSRYIHVVSRANKTLLWPALIEKAYLKVMGGYDFPGSNAASDLFALTTWVPEHIVLHSDNIHAMKLWDRIYQAWGYKDLLLTVGTGKLSQEEERSFGLVSEHDYTIIDLKVLDSDKKAVLIRNPWTMGDEDGAEQDERSRSTKTFWMEFSQISKKQVHFEWDLVRGKAEKALYLCPQYAIENPTSEQIMGWLVLSRHMQTKLDPKTYIGLYIFDESGTRVWMRRASLVKTKLVDSRQTLVRFVLNATSRYTVVVAAETDQPVLTSYSLFLYSISELLLSPVTEGFLYRTAVSGQWTELSSGGSSLSPTFASNPQFGLIVRAETEMVLFVDSSVEAPVHADIVWSDGKRVQSIRKRDVVAHTGEYSIGCAISRKTAVVKGEYTIVVSLYETGVTGDFKLFVLSNSLCTVNRLPDLY